VNLKKMKLSEEDTEYFCAKYKSCTECPLPSRRLCAYEDIK